MLSPGEQLDELVARSATPHGDDGDPDMDASTILGVGGQAKPAAEPAPPAPRPRVTAPQARVAAEGGRRPAPPEARPQPRATRPISPSDPAPVFRNDLQVARTARGYIIRDPSSGQTFPFTDQEVSLARMFNGMRPISDVLEASQRLGIPTSLESLQGFVLRLEQQGLLAAAGEAGSGQAWQARVQWETGVRGMFQSGIRLLRAGRPTEAAGYFEAILQQDPANLEAREMLEMCQSPPQVAAAAVAHMHPPTQPPPFGTTPHPGTQPPPFAMAPHPPTQPPFPPQMVAPMPAPPAAGSAPAQAPPRRIARPTGSQGHAQPRAEMLAVAPPFPAHARRWRVLLPILIVAVLALGVGAYFVLRGLHG